MLKRYFAKGQIEAGCDEVGRGCLAGPVVAAAVILPADVVLRGLNDSKKLTQKERVSLSKRIRQRAISWAIAEASNEEIDRINILNASFLAMHRAIDRLTTRPDFLLIDGNRFKPYHDLPHQCIIKGDGLYTSIAAASVLAKTYRDDLMRRYAQEFTCYHWHTNVGYPTIAHRRALKQHGPSPLHRKSFNLNSLQMELFGEPAG